MVLLCVDKAFFLLEAFQIVSFSLAFVARLQLDWVITTGRLLGPTAFLPHKDQCISLSVLPKNITKELAGSFSTLLLLC